MTDLRVHGALGADRGEPFTFWFEDQAVTAYPGETVATAVLATGRRVLRRTRAADAPRGMFCAIGVCFDCLVDVDGRGPVRACLTPAEPDRHVEGHRGRG